MPGEGARVTPSKVFVRKEEVTGLVLAGGRGSRMDGRDKGLILYEGQPLVAHALKVLSTVADHLLISANRSHAAYASWGYPVVTDPDSEFKGPLSGILAGMNAAETPFMLVMPCDMPKVTPPVLEAILSRHREQPDRPMVVAHDGERMQPLLMLVRTDLAASLQAYLDSGERKVGGWIKGISHLCADLSSWHSDLININRPEDLES